MHRVQSDIVGLDTETNEIFWTYRGVGKQAHGLVVWKEDLPGHTQETPNQHAYFITLSSGEGAVHRVDAQDGTVQRLWQARQPAAHCPAAAPAPPFFSPGERAGASA